MATALLAVSACSADPATSPTAPATTQPPATQAAPSTTPRTPAAPAVTTTAGPATSAPAPTAPLGYTFSQIVETTGTASISIVYPTLVDLGDGAEADINQALDEWARELADRFIAASATAGADAASLLEVELAPEIRSRTVFSISGLRFEYDAAADFSITHRVGWIFSIDNGSVVAAADLFTAGALEPLAAAAEAHLIADVLADPGLLTTPARVAATAENFDAVWLTPEGIAVGFDQYQVAAGDAGSPAVLIPYAELAEVLDQSGVLGALENGLLPAGL
jgi:hypothetical protein